jgi:structural maintenance of chromosome 1
MVRGMIITESANSMDAISFVLGIKSSHLRSSHLKDLVYRGRVLKTSKINDDGSAAAPTTNGHANGDGEGSDEETQSQRPGRNDPKSAWVMAVYEDDAGDEQKWKRTITNQGASEYRINDRVVTAAQYNEALESENILIKARNFLVFQGDVEAIASQSPKDLTRLIEQISGSLEYKAEYERLQEEAERPLRIKITTYIVVGASIRKLSNTKSRRKKPRHSKPRRTSETTRLSPIFSGNCTTFSA